MHNNITIERNLCVGLFILGALGHYNAEEVAKHKPIQYIAQVLHKKHFAIKNGTAEDRLWKNRSFVMDKVRSSPKNREKFIAKGERAVLNSFNRENKWMAHANVADTTWVKASKSFKADNTITVNQLILALLRKEPKAMKWYGFNQKKLDKYADSLNQKTHFIASSRVAGKLLEELDAEIAYFYYRGEENA